MSTESTKRNCRIKRIRHIGAASLDGVNAQHNICTVIAIGIVSLAKRIYPMSDRDKVGDKTGYFAFHNSTIALDDVLVIGLSFVSLMDDCRK